MRIKASALLLCFMAAWTTCQPYQGSANVSQQSDAASAGETVWLEGNGLRLKSKIYKSTKLSNRPMLIVVLHGDMPSPSYHYRFAGKAAMKMDDVVVAALLRPGYDDGSGDRSQGKQGLTTGDNYTPEVVDAVAQVVEQLKARFHPARTVFIGHSGGAAIAGNVLGRWPSEADAAFMVGCPCDLAAWRQHMRELRNNRIWSEPVKSLSPIDLAVKVPPSVRVRLLVGSDDPVTPAELSQRYADVLRKHGHDVTVTIAPGLEHNIFLEPVVFDGLSALVATLKTDTLR